jgi:hypothetical protein
MIAALLLPLLQVVTAMANLKVAAPTMLDKLLNQIKSS